MALLLMTSSLLGTRLLPHAESDSSLGLLPCATNPKYVPAKIKELSASQEALDLLSRMLEASTEQRIAAQEALQHPLVVQSYVAQLEPAVDCPDSKSFVMSRSLTNRSPPLRDAFERAELA